MHNFDRGKSGPKFWVIAIKKLRKEIDRPIGENSPNLVTLLLLPKRPGANPTIVIYNSSVLKTL
jgi:hypothetical protein